MKITALIQEIAQELLPVYQDKATATENSWWLLESLTGLTKAMLLAHNVIELTDEQQLKLDRWLHEIIKQDKPLQYIVGSIPFLSLELSVKAPILIPRPETEEWVANLIAELRARSHAPNTLLDMCTGSGCIALALAKAFPESAVCAVDNNPTALALAQENADRNEIRNVYFTHSDLFAAVAPIQFNLITANPPYIDRATWEQLEKNVTAWEDPNALIAENEGYALIEKIIAQARDFLAPEAHLVMEIGYNQGQQVQQLFEQYDYEAVEIVQDLQKKDRVVRGIWRK